MTSVLNFVVYFYDEVISANAIKRGEKFMEVFLLLLFFVNNLNRSTFLVKWNFSSSMNRNVKLCTSAKNQPKVYFLTRPSSSSSVVSFIQ